MESHVVRIYRCEDGPQRRLVGVVETPGAEHRRAFTNVDELWAILSDSSKTEKRKRNAL